MTTSETPDIVNVETDTEVFWVEYANGWRLCIPYDWYDRLRDATPAQRQHFTFNVWGIHWPEVDEDLSGKGLIQDMVKREGDPGNYDRWLRAKVQASLDDPRPGVPHEQVMAEMEAVIRRTEKNRQ